MNRQKKTEVCLICFRKRRDEWRENQKKRAEILFINYPILERAYDHVIEFRDIYKSKTTEQANKKLIQWIEKTNELNIQEFNSAVNTINDKSETVLNYFINKSKCKCGIFNAKIKLFRTNESSLKTNNIKKVSFGDIYIFLNSLMLRHH